MQELSRNYLKGLAAQVEQSGKLCIYNLRLNPGDPQLILRYLKKHGLFSRTRTMELSCNTFAGADLSYFAELKRLRGVGILHNEPDSEEAGYEYTGGFAFLRWFTDLHVLKIMDDRFYGWAMSCLEPLERLQVLSLFAGGTLHNRLSALERMYALRKLILIGCALRDSDLRSLSALDNLEQLNLESNMIQGNGFDALHQLNGLKRLYLADNEITNEGLDYISTLPNLEVIHLRCNRITDEGLEGLAWLPQLKRLDLKFNPVSAEGLAALRARMPDVIIRGREGQDEVQ